MFEMNVNLCDRFPALDPFTVRKQRFHDVLLIFRRLNNHAKKTERKSTDANGVIRRPATNDDWY